MRQGSGVEAALEVRLPWQYRGQGKRLEAGKELGVFKNQVIKMQLVRSAGEGA